MNTIRIAMRIAMMATNSYSQSVAQRESRVRDFHMSFKQVHGVRVMLCHVLCIKSWFTLWLSYGTKQYETNRNLHVGWIGECEHGSDLGLLDMKGSYLPV